MKTATDTGLEHIANNKITEVMKSFIKANIRNYMIAYPKILLGQKEFIQPPVVFIFLKMNQQISGSTNIFSFYSNQFASNRFKSEKKTA